MAHQIDETLGTAAIAYVGEKPWHRLGTEMQPDAPLEDWITCAGLDWTVQPSETYYKVNGEFFAVKGKKTLYRSDVGAELAVVGDGFKVVQPREVIEFFRDLVENNGMRLSTAGALFGGRRFWALAELGKDFEVVSGDKVAGNLLLTTAVDGTLQTTAKFVSTRVVCQNTMSIAMGEKTESPTAPSGTLRPSR
jgi:phage/plasmid-like protein (TIGR03299 family)